MSVEPFDREVQFRELSAEQRELLMIQVAKRYYELDMTMGELSKELGLTRWQASRLLTEARASGLVRIEIVPLSPRRPDLESRLQRRYNLKDAVIVSSAGDDDPALLLDSVGQAAARLLAGLGKIKLLGVSWGRTMSAVAKHLSPFWNEGGEVVLLNGATNIRWSSNRTNNVAERFAQSADGTATLLLWSGRCGAGFGFGAVRISNRGGSCGIAAQRRGGRYSQPFHRRQWQNC